MHQHPCRSMFPILVLLACIPLKAPAATLWNPERSAPARADVRTVAQSATDVVLEFRLGTVELDTARSGDALWTVLNARGMSVMTEEGRPEVPQLAVWVELPAGEPELEIVEQEAVRRSWGRIRPAAAAQNRARADAPRLADRACYDGAALWPAQPAEITVRGAMQGVRLVLVTFQPVLYSAEGPECVVHTRLRVRIRMADTRSDKTAGAPGSIRQLLERVIINPRETDDPAPVTPSLLVVTEPQFVPALGPYVAWKTRSGIPVQTLIYSEVAGNAPGLRTRIRALCDSLEAAPEYLLIVGDVEAVPPFFGIDNGLTDHPYSLRDDTDYLPDLSVGRIPCQTADECATWVMRLLAYERDASTPVQHRGTVFSSAEWLDPMHGIYVGNLFQGAGMNPVDRLQEPQTGSATELLTSLNGGRQWVFYIGHGSALGWTSVVPDFTATWINQVTASAAPIVVAVACATADLDYPGRSFGEHWLAREGLRGPVAYFGATENTPFLRSDTLGIGALRGVFLQHAERLGPACDLGRLETAQSFPQPPGGLTEETIQQFVLLGDPSMRVFDTAPQPLSVLHPPSLPFGPQELQIHVERGRAPLAGALVCVMSSNPDLYQVQETDATGDALFPVRFAVPAELHVTVTAPNSIPYSVIVPVAPDQGPRVQLAALAVQDPVGDGDGRADRGELCGLRLRVTNLGNDASEAGTVSISTGSTVITLGLNSVPLPAVAPGESLWVETEVPFTVSDTVRNDLRAPLTFRFAAGTDSNSTARVVTLYAPDMEFRNSVLAEDSGDGDGLAEPGERLALRLYFDNRGGEHARNLQWSIAQAPPEVTLISGSGTVPEVVPGDSLALSALLRVDTTAAPGYELGFRWELAGANVPLASGWETRRVGQVPVYLYVLDAAPQQVPAIEAALRALGVSFERGNAAPPDPHRYASIWIFSGMFPNAAALPAADAARLASYVDEGGCCYWEGGDVWSFDPRTPLHARFHITGSHDGSGDAGPIEGETDAPLANMHFEYAGENRFVDRLAPDSGAAVWLRNVRAGATYPVMIAYAGEEYRVAGCAVELGALRDAPPQSTRVHAVRELLTFFGIRTGPDHDSPQVLHTPPVSVHRVRGPYPLVADILDASGVSEATVEYRVGDGVVRTTALEYRDGLFHAALPGAPAGSTIYYRIHAADTSPERYSVTTEEYTLAVTWDAEHPLALTPRDVPAAGQGRGGGWTVTGYPETALAIELHAEGNIAAIFDSEPFDCSALASVSLKFWHYLRVGEGESAAAARILGSVDGGISFPHSVWESAKGGGMLEEGCVEVPGLGWMAGQANVVLRFEFAGQWYWRLRDVDVRGGAGPQTAPVQDLVISPAPPGIRLNWSRVAGARAYAVEAGTTMSADGNWREIFRTADTTFVDLEDSYAARYYQVTAVLNEGRGVEAGCSAQARAGQATLRLPDLRWNRKLEGRVR